MPNKSENDDTIPNPPDSSSGSSTDPTPSHQPVLKQDALIGNNYRLVNLVGKGGMGEVWKAFYSKDNRDVAIKFLNSNFKQHPDALDVLEREFKQYKKLNHENIVQAYEFNRIDSSVFIVMEFLDGISLKQLLKDHPDGMSIEEAEPIIRGMANALAYTHSNGIFHLDFKPANVFYDPEQNMTKVIDFGIARGISDGDKTTLIYERLGGVTETYASYEMLKSLDSDSPGLVPDPRDDIYALACVTYELLSGKHPFERKKATDAEQERLIPDSINGLKPHQEQALLHALAFKREERTPNAEQFFAEFFDPKPEPKLPSKHKLFWGLVIGVGVIVLLAGVAAFFTESVSPHPPIEKCKQYFETGKLDTAKTCYQKVLNLYPKNAEALAGLDKIKAILVEQLLQQCKPHLEKGKWDAALTCYQEVLDLYPNNAEALDGVKEIKNRYWLQIKLQECQQHLDAGSLTQGNDTALSCYRAVLDLDSSNAEALDGFLEIKARYVRGIDTALKHEESERPQGLEQGLKQVNEAFLAVVEKMLPKCSEHLEADQVEIAKTCYQKVLKLDYDNHYALKGLKYCQDKSVECNDLLQKCKTHLDAKPKRLTTGTEGNAFDCYKDVLKQYPSNDEARAGLKAIAKRYIEWAENALRKKQFQKIKGYLAKLEKVDPHSPKLADLKQRLEKATE